jgi:hypothetical protein
MPLPPPSRHFALRRHAIRFATGFIISLRQLSFHYPATLIFSSLTFHFHFLHFFRHFAGCHIRRHFATSLLIISHCHGAIAAFVRHKPFRHISYAIAFISFSPFSLTPLFHFDFIIAGCFEPFH